MTEADALAPTNGPAVNAASQPRQQSSRRSIGGRLELDRTKAILQFTALCAALAAWGYCSPSRFVLLYCVLISIGGATLIGWLGLDAHAADAGEISNKDLGLLPTAETSATREASGSKPLPEMSIEEVRKHNQREDCWIVIAQQVYDVTSFARQHPGGPLPLWGVAGRDATDHFLAFHPRGTENKLKPLHVGRLVGYSPSDMLLEYRELRQKLIDLGLFELKRGFFVRKFVAFMALVLCAVMCVQKCRTSSVPIAWNLVGASLLGIFFQQVAGLGHDVGHNGIIHLRVCDRALGMVLGPLLTGISMHWWKKTHNTHHAVPNSIEYDPDIQHLPVFAVSARYFSSIFSKYHDWTMAFGNVEKLIISYQHILYLPIMALARFNLYAQSLLSVGGINIHSGKVQWRCTEVLCLMGFFSWMSLLCSLLPSWGDMLVFLLVSHAIAGLLHVQITTSHFSMSTYDGVNYKNDTESWFQTQLATTMDVDCPHWFDWFHIGLQFQIEHHLFPRLPRHNLRKVQQLIIPFCKKHGIHHHNVPWLVSVGETLGHLRDVAYQARESKPGAFLLKESLLYAGLQAEG